MNLHDLDKPRMAPGEFFTPEMLQRVRDNYGTYRARIDVPAGATINNIRLYTQPRWEYENAGLTIGDIEDVMHEVRQERDGYWRYEARVTNLDLPRRLDGVFLDTET